MRMKGSLLILFLFTVTFAWSQGGSEIYLMDLVEENGQYQVKNIENITSRPGYDNQPFFSPDSQWLYYSSIREDKQSDIYRYDLGNGKTEQFTNTPESEYSPRVTPDRKYISVVRVEKDSAQRLWKFPLDGGKPKLVLKNIDSIGYHCWLTSDSLAFFILTKPFTLQVAGTRYKKPSVVESNIGRTLLKIPEKHILSFTEKKDENSWLIQQLDLGSFFITNITEALPGTEDFTWHPDGYILAAKDGALFRFVPGESRQWEKIASFDHEALNKTTRIAISPDAKRLAIVASE